MSNCCANTIFIGCFSSCDSIVMQQKATATGTWTAKVRFNGVVIANTFPAVQDEYLTIPNKWPEGLLLSMQLFLPDGTAFDNICYSFKNIINVNA